MPQDQNSDSGQSTALRFGLALGLVVAAQFVLQLDFSIVNVALPTIKRELHFAPADLQWIVTGYALTFGSLLLFGGRVGDLVGHRRVLLAGLAAFGVTSLAAGLSPSSLALIALPIPARSERGVRRTPGAGHHHRPLLRRPGPHQGARDLPGRDRSRGQRRDRPRWHLDRVRRLAVGVPGQPTRSSSCWSSPSGACFPSRPGDRAHDSMSPARSWRRRRSRSSSSGSAKVNSTASAMPPP